METITAATIQDLIAAGRIIEAKALLTVGEAALGAKDLHACDREIAQRLVRAEELTVQAEAMEAAGRTEEAKTLYEAVLPLVADFPGIQEHIKRMDEALLLTRAVQNRSRRLRGAAPEKGPSGKKRPLLLIGAGVALGGVALAVFLLLGVPQPMLRGLDQQTQPEPKPATVQQPPIPAPPQVKIAAGQPQVELPQSSPAAPETPQIPSPSSVQPPPEPLATPFREPDTGTHSSPTEPFVALSGAEPPLPSPPAQLAAGTATPEPAMASKGPGKSARIDRYIVQPGDSLSLIAERLFCSASAWQQIHHLNQGRIPDLMKIQPGLVLRLDGVESRCPPGP